MKASLKSLNFHLTVLEIVHEFDSTRIEQALVRQNISYKVLLVYSQLKAMCSVSMYHNMHLPLQHVPIPRFTNHPRAIAKTDLHLVLHIIK